MRTLFILVSLPGFFTTATAQNRAFKPFKVEASGGLNVPKGSREGAVIAVEPKYALNDQLTIGLRIESAFVNYILPFTNTVDIHSIRSYGFTGDYYFNKTNKRIFVGLVAGLYQYTAFLVDKDNFRRLTSLTTARRKLVSLHVLALNWAIYAWELSTTFLSGSRSRTLLIFR